MDTVENPSPPQAETPGLDREAVARIINAKIAERAADIPSPHQGLSYTHSDMNKFAVEQLRDVRDALARLDARKGEDVDAWAARLAESSVQLGESDAILAATAVSQPPTSRTESFAKPDEGSDLDKLATLIRDLSGHPEATLDMALVMVKAWHKAWWATDSSVLQHDLAQLLALVGIGDHARDQSPHEVFQETLDVLRDRKVYGWVYSWTDDGLDGGVVTRKFALSKPDAGNPYISDVVPVFATSQPARGSGMADVLRALSEKATSGPWVSSKRFIGTPNSMSCIGEVRDQNGNWSDTAKSTGDAAFIAAAVNYVRTHVLPAQPGPAPVGDGGEIAALRALHNLLDRYHVMGCGDGPEALEAARVLRTHVRPDAARPRAG